MESTPEALQFLSQCFLHSLSPYPEPRRQAESALAEAASKPYYGLAVLRLVAESSIDEQIRQSAAISFKNLVKARWAADRVIVYRANKEGSGKMTWIGKEVPTHTNEMETKEKERIKDVIVTAMVGSSPKIRSQLCEALTVIGKHDFPQEWRNLLPELVVTLDRFVQANDYVSVTGVLAMVNSLFKMFRHQYYSYNREKLYFDLMFCVDNFGKPLLEVFKRTAVFVDQAVSSGVASLVILKGCMESQTLCCRIFYSLNAMAFPQFFEDHLHEWMIEFRKYLTVRYSDLEDGGNEGLALVDELRAAICKNVTLHMVRVDLFQRYLSEFVETVWGLLVATSSSSTRERLTVAAIKFLTAVSTHVRYDLFARDDILQQICQSIVIPNVMLRGEDEELFEMNYVEFIRRDMQGSDLDTRRRTACELLKGIALSYKEKVKEKVSAQVQSLLASFLANPAANWKHKDCAIYLVVSLATEESVCDYSLSTDLVDVERFFVSVIIPELRSEDVNGFPMLKAGALKFFTVFRNHISKPIAMALFPDVVRFLGSKSNVVHSYAANCIENLFCVRDEGGVARYSAADVAPFLLTLMCNLFSALQIPESEENNYVMDCIMRVLRVANVSQEISLPCINALATVMNRVCENPKNPIFNRRLFVSVDLLIERSCEQDPCLISAFEERLFPILEMILSRDLNEFFPYAFKLLAQLVDLNITSPLPGSYMQIFAAILVLPEEPWKKSVNRPAFVCLLQAFLRKAPHELNQQGKLPCVVGMCTTLVSSHYSEVQGFNVLKTVIENLEYDVISAYISHIWVALFKRLETDKTENFIKSLIIFMSLFVVKHGSQNLAGSMNAVQPDISRKILEDFWIPNLNLITYSMELKLTSVALTRIMCESLSPSDSKLWGKMLDSIATLVSNIRSLKVEDRVEEVPDFGETVGYDDSTFVKLYNAWRKEEDPLREIHDPEQYLVASLAKLSALSLQ